MERDPELVKKLIQEIESHAESILKDKAMLVSLDRQRQGLREGLRDVGKERKQTLCIGNTFVELSREKAIALMEAEMMECEKEINHLRTGLKKKIMKLHELEGKDEIQGLDLKAISREERDALRSLLSY